MKKLLVIAVLSLFAVSAFADTQFEVFGHYEIEGRYIVNNTVGDSKKTNKDAAYMKHLFRLWGRMLVDDKATITVRTTPVDRRLGGDVPMNSVSFDRAWIAYEIIDGLTLSGGRITGGNYDTNGFGSGYYNASFSEFGGRDGLRADYKLDESIQFFLVTEKFSESNRFSDVGMPQAGDNDSGRDSDAYILGADLAFSDLYVKPRFGVANLFKTGGPALNASGNEVDRRTQLYSGYLGVAYLPAEGLNVDVSGAYVGGKNNGGLEMGVAGKNLSIYGVFGDVSYVKDMFEVGVLAAYASYDKKAGWFNLGGDFDRTIIIDTWMNDTKGVPASTMFQVYGSVTPIERITITPSVAYYMSNIRGGETIAMDYGVTLGKDTRMLEVDLSADYAFTKATTFTVGAAYVNLRKVMDGTTKVNPDGVFGFFWRAYTIF